MKLLLSLALVLYVLSYLANILFFIVKRSIAARLSFWALVVGLLLHTSALLHRAFSSGHLPMANIYETLIFFSFSTVLVTVVVIIRYSTRSVEIITLPLAMVALSVSFFNEMAAKELPLVLKTIWFETHVSSSFVAYAFFTVSFSAAVFYLLASLRGVSSDKALNAWQDIAGRSVLWGFLFFSASMFAGAIWAYLAWGIYWLWEPKVLWSFIVWFWYAGAMHAYHVRKWRGVGLALATVLGFFVVLFTYLGVGLLMKNSHSF